MNKIKAILDLQDNLVEVESPTYQVLDRNNEFYRIKISFPLKKDGKIIAVRSGILEFKPECFHVHPLNADTFTTRLNFVEDN